jgi:hypothetical protein
MRWGVLVGALAQAGLNPETRAPASSLAQQNAKQTAKGVVLYSEELRKGRDLADNYARDGKQQLQEMGRSFRDQIAETSSQIAVHASQISNDIASVTQESAAFRDESVTKSNELADEAQEGLDILAKEMADLTDLARTTMSLMSDTASDFMEEQQQSSEENQAGFREDLAAVGTEVEASRQELLQSIAATSQDSRRQQSGIRRDITDAQTQNDQAADELTGLAAQISELNDEQKAMILNTQRTQLRAIGNAQKEAGRVSNSISKQASRANLEAAKAVNSVLKESRADIKDETKEWLEQAGEVDESNKEKVEELVALGREIALDFTNEVNDVRRDNSEVSLETEAALMEGKKAQLDAADEYATLVLQAKDLKEESAEQLGRALDSSKQNVMSIKGDVEAASAKSKQKISVSLNQLTDRIRGYTREEQSRVSEEINDAAQKLDAKVGAGTNTIEKGVYGLVDAANVLGGAIGDNSQELEEMRNKLSDTVDNLRQTYSDTTTEMGEVTNGTKTEMNSVLQSVNKKLDSVKGQLERETNRAANETKGLAKAIFGDLLNKIEQLKDDAVSNLDRSAKTITTATDRGEAVIQGMAITAENIEKLKTGIAQTLPNAKVSVSGSLGGMKEEIQASENVLSAAQSSAMGTVNAQEDEMRSNAMAEIVDSKGKLGAQLENSQGRLRDELGGVRSEISGLKAGSYNNMNEVRKFQGKTQSSINNGMNKVKYIANEEAKDSAILKDDIDKLQGNFFALTSAVSRGGKMMVAESQQVLNNGLMEDKKRIKNAVTGAQALANRNMNKYGEQGVTEVTNQLQNAEGEMDNQNAKVADLDSSIGAAMDRLQFIRAAAIGKTEGLWKQMKSEELKEMALSQKQHDMFAKQDGEVEKSEDEMMAQQQRLVQRLSDEAGSEGNQAMNEARSSIDKVARDEEAMKDGLAKHTAEYEEHVAAQVASVKQSKDAVSEEVANLEARERDMIQKLNSESGSLASQIDVKQDEVKRLEVQEKQQMTESGGAGVAELTAASDLMGSAQRLTGGEIMELGERVTESLAHYEGAGEQEASGIATRSATCSSPCRTSRPCSRTTRRTPGRRSRRRTSTSRSRRTGRSKSSRASRRSSTRCGARGRTRRPRSTTGPAR